MSQLDYNARKLAEIFGNVSNVQIGISGGLKPDGTVSIAGITDRAIAGDSCPAGTPCIVVREGNQWYARSCIQTGIASEQITLQTRRQPQPRQQNLATFWNLNENYLYKISVGSGRNAIAIANLATQADRFPPPYNDFHGAEPGLVRINASEFYLPNYSRIDRYNIRTNTAESVVSGLSYTYSSCGISSGYAFFVVEEYDVVSGVTDQYILRLAPNGTSDRSPKIQDFDFWSIAAVNSDRVYYVAAYAVCGYYDFASNQFVDLFSVTDFNLRSTLYGGSIDGYNILEITYAFADPKTQTCYVVGLIEDSQIPGYPPFLFTVNNLVVNGDAPELDPFGNPQKIITGDFGPYILPGDSVNISESLLNINRVIDNNTVYGYRASGYWDETVSGTVGTRRRNTRTAIWKIQGDVVSLSYRFPGVDNRETVSGYRNFYNLPCRGGIYDSKTQAIYMIGFRNQVVEAGKFIRSLEVPSQKTLVKIKNGLMQAIAIQEGNGVAELDTVWTWFCQMEPFY